MKNSSKLVSFLVPVISILLAFIIGCVIMAVLGANPFVALQSLWIGAFGSLRNVGTTLARSTPLIFTGLCACFAYRCGVFNLGGEGQFLMGSIVCCYIATQSGIEGLPAILLCLVAGAVAGGLWALIAGLLKVYRGQNEMIITIMLNYVATLFMGVVYTNWLRDGSVPQTVSVPDSTKLSRLFGLRGGCVCMCATNLLNEHRKGGEADFNTIGYGGDLEAELNRLALETMYQLYCNDQAEAQ